MAGTGSPVLAKYNCVLNRRLFFDDLASGMIRPLGDQRSSCIMLIRVIAFRPKVGTGFGIKGTLEKVRSAQKWVPVLG
jgi:hypothetical protein